MLYIFYSFGFLCCRYPSLGGAESVAYCQFGSQVYLITCRYSATLKYHIAWIGIGPSRVADQGWLFPRSRIPDPGTWFLSIPDPGSNNNNKRGGEKKFVVLPFFVATNFTKFKIILFWNRYRKKLFQFTKYHSTFYLKDVFRIWIRDPEETYTGSRGQKGTGSQIPQHWVALLVYCQGYSAERVAISGCDFGLRVQGIFSSAINLPF
jgi:hypothetical protein